MVSRRDDSLVTDECQCGCNRESRPQVRAVKLVEAAPPAIEDTEPDYCASSFDVGEPL